jgi:hypothetical protein
MSLPNRECLPPPPLSFGCQRIGRWSTGTTSCRLSSLDARSVTKIAESSLLVKPLRYDILLIERRDRLKSLLEELGRASPRARGDPPKGLDGSPSGPDGPDLQAGLPDLGADGSDPWADGSDLGANRPDLKARLPDLEADRPDLKAELPDLWADRLEIGADRSLTIDVPVLTEQGPLRGEAPAFFVRERHGIPWAALFGGLAEIDPAPFFGMRQVSPAMERLIPC